MYHQVILEVPICLKLKRLKLILPMNMSTKNLLLSPKLWTFVINIRNRATVFYTDSTYSKIKRKESQINDS